MPRTDFPHGADRFLPLWETDIFVGLFRTAFIIAFVVTGTLSSFNPRAHNGIWALLVVATVFTVALFLAFGAGRSIPHQRLIALSLDLLLVSAAILMLGVGEQQALFQVYYLIVLIGAIWFGLGGALCTAAAAIVLFLLMHYVTIYPVPLGELGEAALAVLRDSGALFLVLIAVIAGFLVRALDRQHQATAQFEQELRLARTVQDTILPRRLPEIPGWELAFRFEPARWVGGDLYEVAELPNGQYLICLGDMPGKSAYGLVHLSLVYSHVHGAALAGLPPAAIANRVNRAVYDVLQPYSYAPLFISMLAPDTGMISFVSCGHLPPLLLRSDGSEEWLSSNGIVIGGRHEAGYEQKQEEIGVGDLLMCYTDGISGVRNSAGEEFGEERISRVGRAGQTQGAALEYICQEIVSQSQQFSADLRSDDATLLLFRRVV